MNNTFKCNNKAYIPAKFLNDLVLDCGYEGEDEPKLKSVLTDGKQFQCKFSDQIPCMEKYSKCFNITNICNYHLDHLGQLMPCRQGNHLENCKSFQCNASFKCKDSYCIPWTYVCDGKWDCSNGFDEAQYYCSHYKFCEKMYKCKGTLGMCIHLGNICNSKDDCPLKDDESHCILQQVKCPLNCRCLSLAITCISLINMLDNAEFPFTFLSLYEAKNSFTDLHRFNRLNVLIIKGGKILTVCKVFMFADISFLDVEFNPLRVIPKNCFFMMKLISVILLNNNDIYLVKPKSFNNLQKLQFISLSNNPMTTISNHFITLSNSCKGFYSYNIRNYQILIQN